MLFSLSGCAKAAGVSETVAVSHGWMLTSTVSPLGVASMWRPLQDVAAKAPNITTNAGAAYCMNRFISL